MKYRNKYQFAQSVINKVPFVRSANIKVTVKEGSVGYTPLKGETFRTQGERVMSHVEGMIDGLEKAYEELVEANK